MPATRSWSGTFRVSGQPGPASSCTMAARCPPPSVIPRAIRRIPCRGTSCVPNTGSWGAVCCLKTGLTRSPSVYDVWSPPRTWRRSGVCSVPLWSQTLNETALTRALAARTVLALATCVAAPCGGHPLPRPLLHRETFQQPTGDDEALNLVRAFAHGEELGVAEVALHGQLLDV